MTRVRTQAEQTSQSVGRSAGSRVRGDAEEHPQDGRGFKRQRGQKNASEQALLSMRVPTNAQKRCCVFFSPGEKKKVVGKRRGCCWLLRLLLLLHWPGLIRRKEAKLIQGR